MRGAPKGNSNETNGKRWAGAIRRALHEYQDDRVKQGTALQEIAMRLVAKALEGDQFACREIGDRLDGKPQQQVAVTDQEGEPLGLSVVYRIPVDRISDEASVPISLQ